MIRLTSIAVICPKTTTTPTTTKPILRKLKSPFVRPLRSFDAQAFHHGRGAVMRDRRAHAANSAAGISGDQKYRRFFIGNGSALPVTEMSKEFGLVRLVLMKLGAEGARQGGERIFLSAL